MLRSLVGSEMCIRDRSKRPAILFDVSSEANKGQAEVFKKTLEAGGTPPVAFETYTSGDKDLSLIHI